MIRIEEMCLNAWPAIHNVAYKGCLFRYSNGYTNRANSANPLYSDPRDYQQIIDYAERFFASRGHSSVFKILENERYAALDQALEQAGYEQIHRTRVLTLNLENYPEANLKPIEVSDKFDDKWFNAFVKFNQIDEKVMDTARRMLDLIAVDLIAGLVIVDGGIAACGYGAMENGSVGFFDIVVDKEKRGNGYGRAIMQGIIAEARSKGAASAYLQVMEDNPIAGNLYASLGFKEKYKYWYRKKTI